MAGFRGFWRVLSRPNSPKFGPTCAELICSAAGAGAPKRLILREGSRLFVRFSRTYGSDAGQNHVNYSAQITYVMNRCVSVERSREHPANLLSMTI